MVLKRVDGSTNAHEISRDIKPKEKEHVDEQVLHLIH
jgi:hypothetical protein